MTLQHKQNELGIYIHIPFCVQKCAYCDFLSAPADADTKERYVQALLQEIRSFDEKNTEYRVVSVFLGGGTPSALQADQLRRILQTVREQFVLQRDAEITVECNPGTLDREKLLVMKENGVNRLSIGVQSLHDHELRALGRIHDRETFLKNYRMARALGYDNINIDLMSGLPGQTVADWKATLEEAVALAPEHISAYSLIIEEGTPFYEWYHMQDEERARTGTISSEGRGTFPALPDEESEREMYRMTQEILAEAGICRYEISNYAKPGRESLHNSGYWTRREYIGFGLGASSMLKNTRFKNTDVLKAYLAGKTIETESVEVLTKEAQMEETMFLGLRMMQGVSENAFASIYKTTMQEVYGEILERMKRQALMERSEDGRWYLTEEGINVSNAVMAEFLLD